jgi:hypothetical protein
MFLSVALTFYMIGNGGSLKQLGEHADLHDHHTREAGQIVSKCLVHIWQTHAE